MSLWSRFWSWYESKLLYSIFMVFIVHIIQIPHMAWNADLYLELGMVSRIHPVYDFILYGVDLLEIPSIINVTILFIYQLRKKKTG